MAVEDSLFRYLRLFLLSKYVNAAKMTNSSVSLKCAHTDLLSVSRKDNRRLSQLALI